MSVQFFNDTRGTSTLEFALVAPLFLAVLLCGTAMGLATWQRNILHDVAGETARCVALGGSACATPSSGCSGDAGTCFATTRASQRGLQGLQPSQVTIDPAATINGTSVTTVTLSFPFSLVGYSTTLAATASFPNGG